MLQKYIFKITFFTKLINILSNLKDLLIFVQQNNKYIFFMKSHFLFKEFEFFIFKMIKIFFFYYYMEGFIRIQLNNKILFLLQKNNNNIKNKNKFLSFIKFLELY